MDVTEHHLASSASGHKHSLNTLWGTGGSFSEADRLISESFICPYSLPLLVASSFSSKSVRGNEEDLQH